MLLSQGSGVPAKSPTPPQRGLRSRVVWRSLPTARASPGAVQREQSSATPVASTAVGRGAAELGRARTRELSMLLSAAWGFVRSVLTRNDETSEILLEIFCSVIAAIFVDLIQCVRTEDGTARALTLSPLVDLSQCLSLSPARLRMLLSGR